MVIIAQAKNGKATVTVNGKAITLARVGKTESGLPHYSRVSKAGVLHVYGQGKATLKPDGKTGGGNPKFAVKNAGFKAFAILPKAGKKLAVAF